MTFLSDREESMYSPCARIYSPMKFEISPYSPFSPIIGEEEDFGPRPQSSLGEKKFVRKNFGVLSNHIFKFV